MEHVLDATLDVLIVLEVQMPALYADLILSEFQ